MSFIHPKSLCQIEITVSYLQRSLNFYRAVFGWQPAPAELHEYVILSTPPDAPFGISLIPQPTPGQRQTSQLVLYFSIDTDAEAEKILKEVTENGGTVRFGPKKVPGYGEIWQFADPDGQRFGLFKCGGVLTRP